MQNVNTLEIISYDENPKQITNYDRFSIKYDVIPKCAEYTTNKEFKEVIIFCEQDKKPKKWDDDFYVENAKVYWADEWEYNKYGIPCVKGK